MRILAIDTALANCAAAVLDDGDEKHCHVLVTEEIGRGHAERLMEMIGEAMAESSSAFTDLDRVVVTTGPGSFTGLRVGLSVAKGIGLVLEKPVVGVTTLAVIAASTSSSGTNGAPFLVALNGKGDEVYCQSFDAGGSPIEEPGVRTVSELATSLSANVKLAGSAARTIAEAAGRSQDFVLNETSYPDIAEVARLGIISDPRGAIATPLYLRPPDATPQKKGRIERQ
ncbi:tRNA (adenosine(37)-N6)-threonylcarbamoyltransferase complex dimerization subunit type 1 TsaB [Roseibium algae]|uniref:tRNA (Adenosine(37)-N6)-threonylcarbamoyltransferase complex dimerization subunit type 1 TsaB n=1 Tax=Roseibium algae TaxID=3123038 RepID=A0ABU8TMR7_9HYPH